MFVDNLMILLGGAVHCVNSHCRRFVGGSHGHGGGGRRDVVVGETVVGKQGVQVVGTVRCGDNC